MLSLGLPGHELWSRYLPSVYMGGWGEAFVSDPQLCISGSMLRLFRHIRARRVERPPAFQKDSQCALGEILLVVIGILIALQINNWNEAQNEQQQIREYLLKLSV